MIERQGPLLLSWQCQLLGLSHAALYHQAVRTDAYVLELMALIDRQYLQIPLYGSRRKAAWLQAQGHVVNRKRMQRLMLRMGLAATYQRPRTSRPPPEHRIYPYLCAGLGSSGSARCERPISPPTFQWRKGFSIWSR
jgi:putative transposase